MNFPKFLINFFFWVILIGAWVWTIIRIAKSEFKKDGQKTAWLIIVILLNYIGMMAYYFFGIKQIKKRQVQPFNNSAI